MKILTLPFLVLIIVQFIWQYSLYGENKVQQEGEPSVIELASSCSAEVNYKWKRAGDKPLEHTIFWVKVEVEGETQARAKEKLEDSINREKKKASEQCRNLHENLSGCISSRLEGTRAVLSATDFEGRRAIQNAIFEDCKGQQGQCIETNSSNSTCRAIQDNSQKKDEPEKTTTKDKKK
jgi:hypothetical protein